jgi:uncharacterized protein (DUF1800 family)
MSASNPHIKHLDRAPYELGRLIAMMPRSLPRDRALTADELQMLEAVSAHASTAMDNIEHGLEALGALLFSASESKEFPIDSRHIGAIGTLIKHLAVESQFARRCSDHAASDLSNHEALRAKNQSRKGATA